MYKRQAQRDLPPGDLAPGNDWIQLYPGKNTYQYGAKQGVEHLDVKLEYTLEYWGA